jgi:hypothetical protein
MFFYVLFLYAFVMLWWPIVVAVNRGAKSRGRIIVLTVLLPMVFVAMELLLGISGGGASDENFSGAADYMPTVGLVCYVGCSISLVVWAHCAKGQIEPRGFPIEPTNSVASNDSDPV